MPPRRVWIVGTSGSGKTTLAGAAARRLGVPHVELDALQHGANWTEATPRQLAERTEAALAGGAWVVDGNYPAVREAFLGLAEQVVWLDYPRPLLMSRVVRRTASRLVTRRRLWNGNRERLRDVVTAGHPVRWAWTTHAARRLELEALADPRWVRCRRPAEAARWLRSLTPVTGSARGAETG